MFRDLGKTSKLTALRIAKQSKQCVRQSFEGVTWKDPFKPVTYTMTWHEVDTARLSDVFHQPSPH